MLQENRLERWEKLCEKFGENMGKYFNHKNATHFKVDLHQPFQISDFAATRFEFLNDFFRS